MGPLDLESALIDQLKAVLPEAVSVRRMRDLANVESTLIPAPAVYVIYAGGAVLESRKVDAAAARVENRWVIAAVVRSMASAAESSAIAALAPIAQDILTALMGWQPPGAAKPLSLAGLPVPGYGNGYLWLPLEFATELVLRPTVPSKSLGQTPVDPEEP